MSESELYTDTDLQIKIPNHPLLKDFKINKKKYFYRVTYKLCYLSGIKVFKTAK